MIDFSNFEPRQSGQHSGISSPQTKSSGELVFETVTIRSDGLKGSSRAATKLNDFAGAGVIAFLLISPIPFGANHPVAWLAFAISISLFSMVYVLLMSYIDPERPFRACRYPAILGLVAALLLFCAAQLLPFDFGALAGLPDQLLPRHLTVSAPVTALGLIRILSYALLFVLVLEICTNPSRARWLLKGLFYVVFAHAVWALISLASLGDTLLLSPKTAYLGFATGTFINRNSFATFLSMGLMIGLGNMMFIVLGPAPRSTKRASLWHRLSVEFFVQTALTSIILAALLATGSRLGVLSALVGGLFLLTAMLLKANKLPRWRVGATLLGVGVGAFLAILAATPLLATRLVFFEQNLGVRVELYRQSLAMIFQRPFLGYGLDSFPIAFELFHQPSLATSLIWDKAHNTYITLWVELGVIVGSIPLLILGLSFVRMLADLKLRQNTYFLPAVTAASLLVCAVHSLGDFSLEMAANAYLFTVLTAIGISERV